MRAIAMAVALASTASCGGVECAVGTFKSGDDCVGFDPNDKTPPVVTLSPPARRSRDPLPTTAVLATDEPATIFFTTDGSEPDPAGTGEVSPATIVDLVPGTPVKYFAIDRAGNQSAPESALYDSDTTPPGIVGGMTITLAGADATIAWTNPSDADYTGTVLARVGDLVDVDPEPGQLYTAATALSPSLQIVQVSTGTTFTDPGRLAGPARYVAWTFDDLGNYSEPIAVRTEIPRGSLAFSFTFDTATQTLTPTVTSPHITTTGTTASSIGTAMTLSLQLANTSAAHVHNPKAQVVSVVNGSFTGSDGIADGLAFENLGPASLGPGASVARPLTFTVTAGAVVTVNLTLGQHPTLFTRTNNVNVHGFADSGAAINAPAFTTTSLGPNNQGGRLRPSMLVGEHFVDVPTTHGSIERWDLATGTRTTGIAIAGSIDGKADVVALLPTSAREIAIVKLSRQRDAGPVRILRFDESLRETGRLDLPLNAHRGFVRPAISPDGALLALPLVEGIALIDTRTMTQIDANPGAPGVDLVDHEIDDEIRSVTFFDGVNGFVVVARRTGTASVFKLVGGIYTKATTLSIGGRGHAAAVGPDGLVRISFDGGLRIYNPADDSVTTTAYPFPPNALRYIAGQLWIVRSDDRRRVDLVNDTGAVLRTVTLSGEAIGHWLEASSR